MSEAADKLARLGELVHEQGACSLPGVSIDFGLLRPAVLRAVERGFVTTEAAEFVLRGLRWGFDLGVNVSLLPGKRWFQNYPPAWAAREQVTKAIKGRVDACKTIPLCAAPLRDAHTLPWSACRVFPMGAVPKPLEPTAVRPVSDHTRTGLKAATDMTQLKHSLDAVEQIAANLLGGYFMRMSDVDSAFPLLPLAPELWPFFLLWWFDVSGETDDMWLYVHVTGDFGAAGLPGTWKLFFTDVMCGVARSEGVLTLPMPVYVDDCALIGAVAAQVDAEGLAFTAWLQTFGVFMKELKDRAADQLQLALGFWWDSVQRTRTLEERKLQAYLDMLREFAKRRSLSLREMQQVGGRMQRAVMTLPRGAHCFLAALFALMRGLSLPWQQRRTNRAVRADFTAVADLLEMNLGRGFFCFDHMPRAPAVFTDASKQRGYVGGGFVSMCGRYSWWSYGSSAARQPIDWLEGDAVLVAAMALAESWRGCVVPLYIDNRSFQLSAVKGWSKAERLVVQLRALFAIAVKVECVFEFHWISTHDNVFADALSRAENVEAFMREVAAHPSMWRNVVLHAEQVAGAVRTIGDRYPEGGMAKPAMRLRGAGAREVISTKAMVPYSRASVFKGLPKALEGEADELMDARLAPSSHASVQAALRHWEVVRARHRWPLVMVSDDPDRGGKLAAYALYLVYETDLAGSSVTNYVWGLRTYMKHCKQLDPAFGVVEWDDFMAAVAVVSWSPSEPRKMVPLALVRRALEMVDVSSFEEVQAAVLMLVLLFTFARSETPCPKTQDGFDIWQHLQVKDVEVRVANGVSYVAVRLKRIKQDRRMERDTARGNEDWVYIGEDASRPLFSVLSWLKRLFALHRGARAADGPFFVHATQRGQVPLTYGAAMTQVRALWARASSADEAAKYGLHSLRVLGYNLSKRAVGDQLTVAHGGWSSDAHERYERFALTQVLALPRGMLEAGDEAPDDAQPPDGGDVAPRPLPVASARRGRSGGAAAPAAQAMASARSPGGVPAAVAAPLPPPRPLTLANAHGRRVLCPADMWPAWACAEHGGRGWEAVVQRVRVRPKAPGPELYVQFVSRARGAGKPRFHPLWILMSAAVPL